MKATILAAPPTVCLLVQPNYRELDKKENISLVLTDVSAEANFV